MKTTTKALSLLLCLLTLFSLFGCGKKTSAETPPAATEQKRDYSHFAGIVADPKSWYEELMALPIANENMSEEELRQLCVDAMRMNLTFRWTPTIDINYSFTLLERTSEVSIPANIAYSGLFYCNNNARGNVWKALQYYDRETGAMDIEAMNGDVLSILSSACARGCEWGWSRVSNSHGLETMASYNQYNSNIALVGEYKYALGKYSFASGSGTKDIIAENGEDVILRSYAVMKMADGVYSSSSYHVMMVAEAPVIVYDEDGNIDAEESYAIILEQDAVGSKTKNQDSLQENGITLRALGGVDKKYTFRDLLDKGYVPFTIKELIGQDPVEAGEAYIGGMNSPIESGADLPLDQILSKTLFTNYAICTVETQIQNPDGDVLLSHIYNHQTTPHTYHVSLSAGDLAEKAVPYANGKNTVHVYVRLSTGELKEAFTTVLKIS